MCPGKPARRSTVSRKTQKVHSHNAIVDAFYRNSETILAMHKLADNMFGDKFEAPEGALHNSDWF